MTHNSSELAATIRAVVERTRRQGLITDRDSLLDSAWGAVTFFAMERELGGVKKLGDTPPGVVGFQVPSFDAATRIRVARFVNKVLAGQTPGEDEYPFQEAS